MNAPFMLLALPILLSFQIKDTTIQVSNRANFTIRLHCAAGQGYSWKLTNRALRKIQITGKETFESLPDSRPGSDGIQVFHFKAITTGKEILHFIYLQPFAKAHPQDAPQSVFHILINNR